MLKIVVVLGAFFMLTTAVGIAGNEAPKRVERIVERERPRLIVERTIERPRLFSREVVVTSEPTDVVEGVGRRCYNGSCLFKSTRTVTRSRFQFFRRR